MYQKSSQKNSWKLSKIHDDNEKHLLSEEARLW